MNQAHETGAAHLATEAAAQSRRQQIMSAALSVFARHGLANAKMSMIADEAGISQGLPYRYFSSKEELFTRLVEHALSAAAAAIAEAARLPGSPPAQLTALTRTMLAGDHRRYFQLIQQAGGEAKCPPPVLNLLKRYHPQEMFGPLIPIIIEGQRTGEFRPGRPFDLLFLLFSVIAGLLLQTPPTNPDRWVGEAETLMKLLQP